ncbi:hypothetical protein [Thaumasiovibrio subtropicus]|uniref:hypothetical protein n=1 Tax=Thaumasiovibrio subtropicus TaxID=1891207 RepID=UPI000B361E59|nr:hypothetical protein [Thaumasiovibrio subtropicus]
MDHEFWHARWAENRIGFHQQAVHPLLIKYWPHLTPSSDERVIIPLCGKSLDIDWLCARHQQVVGVELSDIAVNAFFSEQMLIPTMTQLSPRHRIYSLDELTIHQTDFFMFRNDAPFELAYDRAGLIALAPEQRQRYVDHLMSMLVAGGRLLLINIVPKVGCEPQREGPPFFISDEDIVQLFSEHDCQCLETFVTDDEDRFDERVWLIQKKEQ